MQPDVFRLHSDHLQPSKLRHGPQQGGLVPCRANPHHGHYPADEGCPQCPPPPERLGRRYYQWCADAYPLVWPLAWDALPASERALWDTRADDEVARWLAGDDLPCWHPGY